VTRHQIRDNAAADGWIPVSKLRGGGHGEGRHNKTFDRWKQLRRQDGV
jgi:hypothetical protein